MLGTSYDGDGSASGNVQNVTGMAGSIVDGLSLDYIYDTGPDSYVDILSADGGELLFQSQDGNGRAVCYDGPSNNYRVVNSSVVFGALRDAAGTKNQLMDIYMDYLTGQTGIESGTPGSADLDLSVLSPSTGTVSISCSLPEAGNVRITLYDISGRRAGVVHRGYLVSGDHTILWNGPGGGRLATGTYMLRLETGGETASAKLVMF